MISKVTAIVLGTLIAWAGLALCVELFWVMFFDGWLGGLPWRAALGLSGPLVWFASYQVGAEMILEEKVKAKKLAFDPKVWKPRPWPGGSRPN